MNCSGCKGCFKNNDKLLKDNTKLENRVQNLLTQIEDINNKLKSGIDNIDSEELLLNVIDIEKDIKKIREKALENYINKKISLEIQMGNLESIEDLNLYLKRING